MNDFARDLLMSQKHTKTSTKMSSNQQNEAHLEHEHNKQSVAARTNR